MNEVKKAIDEEVIQKALSYEKYYQLIKELLEKGKTTGREQKESQVKHARLNFQRMKRVYRTTLISDELKSLLQKIDQKQLWVVLSEGWCGDAAQSLPAIAKIAEQSEKVELKILLRDENPEVMNTYLTNGGKSIPKLIALDERTKSELFTWGPRPETFQQMVIDHKNAPKLSEDSFNQLLHKAYAEDKTQMLQSEFKNLIRLSLN